MKIGLIGSGGREHAIAKALTNLSGRNLLYAYGNHINPGIKKIAAVLKSGQLHNLDDMVSFFISHEIELVVVGPELPLIAGVTDKLRSKGILTVGPTRAQSQLEGSKVFMRDLMQRRVGEGALQWREICDLSSAEKFISEIGQIAIKPIGLTGGKGVWVMGVHFKTMPEALEKIEQLLQKDGTVLLEERLIGEEFSRMAFVSNGIIVPMPVAQDFKYAYDQDRGGMTGGMGSYTMANGTMPFLTERDLKQADEIIKATVTALEQETGEEYRGFLYGQFMATVDGVRVIEYNVRLGDPEAINIMTLLDVESVTLFKKIAEGSLDAKDVRFLPQASICKYLVPAGYPETTKEHVQVTLDESQIKQAGFHVIYASVSQNKDGLVTHGSRAFALVGLGDNVYHLSNALEKLLDGIEPPTLRHRKDIGDENVVRKKIQKMNDLRKISAT